MNRIENALDLLAEVPVHRRQQAIARAYNIAVRDIGAAGSSRELESALKNMKLIGDICRDHAEIYSLIRAIDGRTGNGPNVVINVSSKTPNADGF